MHEYLRQKSHFFLSALRWSRSLLISCSRRNLLVSSSSSTSLKPPAAPTRVVPLSVPLTAARPERDELQMLQVLRLPQFQLLQLGHFQPSEASTSAPCVASDRGWMLGKIAWPMPDRPPVPYAGSSDL